MQTRDLSNYAAILARCNGYRQSLLGHNAGLVTEVTSIARLRGEGDSETSLL